MENANPVLVEVWRGPLLESKHRGLVCIVDAEGKIVFSAGNVQQVIYPRSSLKPFQVLPLLELGGMEKFGFTLEEIAIMCGSHNGQARHLQVVQSILDKIDATENLFDCGAHYPWLQNDVKELYVKGAQPRQLHNNCSGKHAGFLALCKLIDAPLEGYLNPNHPAQLLVRKAIAEVCEINDNQLVLGLDGCSAPVYAMPAYNMAVGYKNLAVPQAFSAARQKACATVIQAMGKHSFMVAGDERYDTDMMTALGHEVIGKVGAEGVFGLTFHHTKKYGVAIKIDDGKMQPQYAVSQYVIQQSKLFDNGALAPLQTYLRADILNHAKRVTGYYTVNEQVFAGMEL